MQKIILITGASSGMGYETARILAEQGHRVYGAARRVERIQELAQYGVQALPLDITDEASIEACVKEIIAREGRIDVLVNNAGYGYLGAIEDVSMAEAKRQFEVNIFGLARLTQLVLPYMRAQRSGRVVNLASMAGRMTFAFGGWYNATKYSLPPSENTLSHRTGSQIHRVSARHPPDTMVGCCRCQIGHQICMKLKQL